MKKLFISLFIVAYSLSLSAVNYYASPNGSGDGSSESKPTTFSKALGKLKAGDTLYLLGGQYNLNTTKVTVSGSSSKVVTICNYDATEVIFDFRKTAYGKRGLEISSKYLHLKGITLRYSGKNALYCTGSNNTFENLQVYGNGDSGVQMKGEGGNNLILNVDSYDNFDYGNTSGSDLAFTGVDYGGNADGFADKQYTGAPNRYVGCRAWNNSDDGWDFFQRVTTSGETLMEKCICYNNGPASYDMTNHGRYETDKSFFEQFKSGKSVTDDEGNKATVTLSNFKNWGNGNGFKVGGKETKHNVKVVHCLAVGNTVKGFDQNNNAGTMYFYNCTGYKNKGCNFGFHNSKGTLTVRNSVSLSGGSKDVFKTKTTADHNTWNGTSCSTTDFLSTDLSESIAPRNADGSLPTIALMHLQENSKLIDAGVNVGYEYVGKAPDLGCYEFGVEEGEIVLPATLTCTAGSLSQNIKLGEAINPVTLTWGGSATDVTYSTLPDGIKATKSNSTITFSGTPNELGNYGITVTTIGKGSEKSVTLTINVKDPSVSSYAVAYVTLPDDERDATILNQLHKSNRYEVTILDASKTNDYNNYDVIVLSPVPSTKNTSEYNNLKGINKPMLILKPWIFKTGPNCWSWGTAINSSDNEMTITQANHLLFTGLNTSSINVFSQVNTNGVTAISAWDNCTGLIELARNKSNNGTCIAEMPIGANMNGTKLTQTCLMIGVSEYSTANLTTDGLILIDNAVLYLLGLLNHTGITETVKNEYTIIQHTDGIEVKSTGSVHLTLYNTAGQMVRTAISNTIYTDALPNGIYILHIQGSKSSVLKILIQ